jgi:hypothetical protein
MVYFDFINTKKPVNHLIYRLLEFLDILIRRGSRILTCSQICLYISDLHLFSVLWVTVWFTFNKNVVIVNAKI